MRRPTQRGAASLETLTLLPFFFIVWGCLVHVYRVHERRVVLSEIARGAGWAELTTSCLAPPPGRVTLAERGEAADEELGAAGTAKLEIERRFADAAIDLRGMFGGALARPTFASGRDGSVPRPRVIGGGELPVTRAFHGMCDELPPEARPPAPRIDALMDVTWCRLTGWCI